MTRKLNILIVDFYSASNRGDAAILEGMKHSLLAVFPSASLTVFAYQPHTVRIINNLQSQKVLVEGMTLFSTKFLFFMFLVCLEKVGLFRRIIKFLLGRYKKNQLKYYFEADLVISVGGAHLNDNYKIHLLGRLFGLWFAKALGKKVIVYSQSLGPFSQATYRILAKIIFEKLDVISVRDEDSKTILKNLGVRKPPIVVTADAAFAMNLDLNQEELKLLQNKIVAEGDPFIQKDLTVSISLRDWPWGELKNEDYLEVFAKFIDWLIETKNASIVLCSTCTGFGGYHMDDRVQGFYLKERVKKKENVYIFENEYKPKELANIYGKVGVHIGTRMHSCILAMLAGTAVIPIAYEQKTRGLMRPISLDHLVVEYDQLSVGILIERFNEIFNNLDKYQSLVRDGVEILKAKTSLNERMLQDLMKVSK